MFLPPVKSWSIFFWTKYFRSSYCVPGLWLICNRLSNLCTYLANISLHRLLLTHRASIHSIINYKKFNKYSFQMHQISKVIHLRSTILCVIYSFLNIKFLSYFSTPLMFFKFQWWYQHQPCLQGIVKKIIPAWNLCMTIRVPDLFISIISWFSSKNFF